MTIIYKQGDKEIFRVSEVSALCQADKEFMAKFGRQAGDWIGVLTIIERTSNEDHER